MLQFFSTLVATALRAGTDRLGRCRGQRCEDFDYLSDPRIARMDARQLADLPFPRSRPAASCAVTDPDGRAA